MVECLSSQSRRLHGHHPNQHTDAELELIRDTPLQSRSGYGELWHRRGRRDISIAQRACSGSCADRDCFLRPAGKSISAKAIWADNLSRPACSGGCKGIRVGCVQTDNGFKLTNRFSSSRQDLPTLFELGIWHKRLHPYTPRYHGKVERSHRENQKRVYSCHNFYSIDDFSKQLAAHNCRSNNFLMRPLGWLSPAAFSVQYVDEPIFCRISWNE